METDYSWGCDDTEMAIAKWLKGLSEYPGGNQALLFCLSEQVRLGGWCKPIDPEKLKAVFSE